MMFARHITSASHAHPRTPRKASIFRTLHVSNLVLFPMWRIAGMSMGVKNTRKDMVVQLHLDAVTVQDMSRPSDSPFRHMMQSTPDATPAETSHGGLIHITYWASADGVRRVPPPSIADTNQTKFDMVLDARISILQVRSARVSCCAEQAMEFRPRLRYLQAPFVDPTAVPHTRCRFFGAR